MGEPGEGWSRRCTPPDGLVLPVRVDPTGVTGPTPGQARGREWRRTSPGLYVPSHVDPQVPEQRIIEQGARLRPGGALTGWASGRLLGAGYFDGLGRDGRTELPVPLTTGAILRLAPWSGCLMWRDRIYEDEIVFRLGVPCAVPPRAVFDAMRYAGGLRAAVVAMDMFASAGLISIAGAAAYVTAHPAWEGVQLARDALGFADERSWSPQETDMRSVWRIDAGLPPPLCNWPVFTRDGQFVGRPDLLDLEAGVVGEYDGALHLPGARRTRDVGREQAFRDLGLEYFTVTAGDRPHRGRIVDRMLAARARALWLPEHERRWTIELPPWWREEEDLLTLDERLDLPGRHDLPERDGHRRAG